MSSDPTVEATIDLISELLNRRIGLRSEPNLRARLERCIRDDAEAKIDGVNGYVQGLMNGGAALQSLVNRVTVQETAFFRHPEHFEVLTNDILPGLTPPVTIWSAGCSNGQEAYSLAMLLDELGIQGSIIATDLSTTALARTVDAEYTDREIGGLSPQRIKRHLDRRGDRYQIKRDLRARVSTVQHNLLDPIPTRVNQCQVVFCRNVLIYFAPLHARAFLGRVSSALPGAAAFLGAAETIWQLTDHYDTIRTGDTFFYRSRTAGRPPAVNQAGGTGRPGFTRGHDGARTFDVGAKTARTRAPLAPVRPPRVSPRDDHQDSAMSTALGLAGQRASAAGDVAAAVVAFRKCAYLTPHNPMAHLNLGLALETAGDRASAQRAYAAARNALSHADPARVEQATEGYTIQDLLRFIQHKQQAVQP